MTADEALRKIMDDGPMHRCFAPFCTRVATYRSDFIESTEAWACDLHVDILDRPIECKWAWLVREIDVLLGKEDRHGH